MVDNNGKKKKRNEYKKEIKTIIFHTFYFSIFFLFFYFHNNRRASGGAIQLTRFTYLLFEFRLGKTELYTYIAVFETGNINGADGGGAF